MICVKEFGEYPFAHRQPKHDGHCSLIHGHNWKFRIHWTCDTLDENGFVTDFGKQEDLKELFKDHFDHTLVLCGNDPELSLFAELDRKELCKLVVVNTGSCEGIAQLVYQLAEQAISETDRIRGVQVVRVAVFEDSKNSVDYIPTDETG